MAKVILTVGFHIGVIRAALIGIAWEAGSRLLRKKNVSAAVSKLVIL